jgi:pimeloyl-ACP methyl ester carboxylesterase
MIFLFVMNKEVFLLSLSDVLWLNVSPSFQCLTQPLLCSLSSKINSSVWNYQPNLDEACSLEKAISRLHNYLKTGDRPVHLIGHSTSGLLGLMYARRYPETVKSLTLLAVGVDAAVDWQVHYYIHRPYLSRQKLLAAMVDNLFGYQNKQTFERLVKMLEQDLDNSLSPHSLFQRLSLPPGEVSVPMMVCGSLDDIIVEPDALQNWQPWLKKGDRIWVCPEGKHFFYYFQPELLGNQLLDFWNSLL